LRGQINNQTSSPEQFLNIEDKMEHNHQHALSYNFSVAFEQMCVMAAVAQTRDTEETLKELILYCFTRFTDEKFSTPVSVHDAVLVLSGLDFPQHEIISSLESLDKEGKIVNTNGNLSLPLPLKLELMKNVDEADKLETDVQNEWFKEVSSEHHLIPLDGLWQSLKKYLSLAFRRHGIQTITLLDPSVKIANNGLDHLSGMLDTAVDNISVEYREVAKTLIRNFMASVGKSFRRTKYITQIADGAFNYFALAIIPEVAENFRKNLTPLTLYLDTNFLFGILDLTVNPQVAVSMELMEAIRKYNLPFELRYHQRTETELLRSISMHRENLRNYYWPKQISSGVVKSRAVSGVELRYHQKNSVETIDVDTYFSPFEHLDAILAEKNITKYIPSDERTIVVSSLSSEYQDYLDKKKRDKSDLLREHDMTVLDTVRLLRTQAKNTLEAGALLITCDYTLYGFDWEASRREGLIPCTVLPNLFWQLLRPFINADGDFDRSFAETFAIPEFRLIGSDTSVIASRMAAILTSFKGISEELATRMLSNDLLVGKLRNYLLDDVKFHEQVELAIVEEHSQLEEEHAKLQEKFSQTESEKNKLATLIIDKDKELEERRLAEENLLQELEESQSQANKVEKERYEKERRLEEEKSALKKELKEEKERNSIILRVTIGTIISLFILIGFEIAVHTIPWTWFVHHRRYLGIQGCIILFVPLAILTLIVPKYRKSLVVPRLLIGVITVFLSIIDGV
jgi:hypothetical protein